MLRCPHTMLFSLFVYTLHSALFVCTALIINDFKSVYNYNLPTLYLHSVYTLPALRLHSSYTLPTLRLHSTCFWCMINLLFSDVAYAVADKDV